MCLRTSTESVAEPTRPEGLPEKFKTWDDMAKSYGELSTWKGKKEEDIKDQVLQELETEAYATDLHLQVTIKYLKY